MNYGPLLFFGIFLTIASSWCGLVLIPQLQFGSQQAVKLESGEQYPPVRPGGAQRGEAVYRANGCIYCHSQQVRAAEFGADIKRNWGTRRTVALDYIRDKPVMLGTMRTGPDLSNIGVRNPSRSWQLTHLFNPQSTSAGSVMPPFGFLFEARKTGQRPASDALQLPAPFNPPPGFEVVPTQAASDLVDYLLSLKANVPLPEAK